MKRKSRKKPCRICGKWFLPDPGLGIARKHAAVTNVRRNGMRKNVPNGTGRTKAISRKFI